MATAKIPQELVDYAKKNGKPYLTPVIRGSVRFANWRQRVNRRKSAARLAALMRWSANIDRMNAAFAKSLDEIAAKEDKTNV